jgi:tetratricopeptide (TPR) repeat protein
LDVASALEDALALAVVQPGPKAAATRESLGRADRYLRDHPRGPAAGRIQLRISRGWFALGEMELALRAIQQAAADPRIAGTALVGMAEIYDELGRPAEAVAALGRAISARPNDTHRDVMDADSTANIAVERLARVHEARGEWRQSLALYDGWQPRSWCGNELGEYQTERTVGRARALFHLGHQREALSAVAEAARKSLNDEDAREAWFGYIELGALGGALDQVIGAVEDAQRAHDELTEFRRPFLARVRRFARAVSTGRYAEILRAAGAAHRADAWVIVPAEFEEAGRLAAGFGKEAIALLEEQIARGDPAAVAAAGFTADPALLPPLEERLRREPPGYAHDRAKSALLALRQATSPRR